MTIGTRVQIPVWTDRWMMGDRYGVVVKLTKKGIAHVHLDKSGKTIRFKETDLEDVGTIDRRRL